MEETDVIQDFDTRYEQAYAAWDAFYPLAERDLEFFLGQQWNAQERRALFDEGRSAFVFNRARRNINMVTGYQRKHRLASVVNPVEGSDQETADQLNELLMFVMQSSGGYELISDCFGGALKTGWNLASVWLDYRDDPLNGDIRFSREPYNGFIVDPYFTQHDFSDAAFILSRRYLYPDYVKSLLPGMDEEIDSLAKFGWSRDDKFSWLPYQQMPTGEEMMAYNEMFTQRWRNIPMLVDMQTGETTEFDVDDERLSGFLQMYPQLKVIDRPKRYIEKHIIVNDKVMKSEINPFGLDEYPFVPFTAIFEPESNDWALKIQSLMRCMIDPQREANRRRSQMTDILDSQINSGWIATEDSVINPRSLFQSSQGKVIWRKRDAAPGAVEKIPPSQIPPSMFQLADLYDRDMVEIAGINEAAFGEPASGQESGVLMMLRQGASIVNLQELFDNLRKSQKALSTKVLKLIQTWRPNKVQRILNQEPAQQFYHQDFTKYDVSVGEGILTDTQKQMYFRQLVELRNLGVPVTGEMLAEAAPIQGKTSYVRQLAESEKAQAESAQKQQAIQQELLDSQRQMAQAKAISDVALSKERFTRAVANNSLSDERAAQAVEDRTDAALNRIKAIKELQEMDDKSIVRYLELIRILEERSRQDENEIKLDDVAIASSGESMGQALSGMPQPLPPSEPQVPNNPQLEASNEIPGL